ncbi:TMEM175 family protein [Methanobacterium alcaliphilum]|uniref:TMEM175 family protein n=1 Tax=Methanobacterium alcaliphilum TaxID=392018 RepID=UPI00200AD46B|nr:TMEM175 family protein [Methanobacterium alcaliphilum]MCK9151391.1 TMEM175 family protein [Methanobacterium alcaliphilum]
MSVWRKYMYMGKNRIETLVDGIFAIAMTLLVLDLAVPHINGPLNEFIVQNALYGLVPSFISMVVSFVLLAMFWNIHHRIYSQIKSVNNTLLWINIIWLLFIVLVPFSASLNGEYGDFTISDLIFNVNMLGIALILLGNIYIIKRDDVINEKVDVNRLASSEKATIIFILIAILAIVLSFIVPRWGNLVYLLIFPIEMLMDCRS